jgi:phosphate acyltransferase
VLSNGSEEHKGTALTREAHQLLCRAGDGAGLEYIGYIEGRDVFRGEADVVVTDGFTGNVVLKSVEGAAEVIMTMVKEEISRAGLLARLGAGLMIKALRRLKRRTDYAEYGGAPLVGVDGVALICHGGSNAKAIKNAVRIADRFAQTGLGPESAAAIAGHAFLWEQQAPAAAEVAR